MPHVIVLTAKSGAVRVVSEVTASPAHGLFYDYQTFVAAILGGVATLIAAYAAFRAISKQLKAADETRKLQVADERRAAALMIWAEVRMIGRSAREWTQKWSRNYNRDPDCQHKETLMRPIPVNIQTSYIGHRCCG